MTIKLLINAVAGVGKTSLLESMGEDTFVVSRDGKAFGLPLPHMLVTEYVNMDTLLYGGSYKDDDGNDVVVEGVAQKLEIYEERFGSYPTNVVFDSVSQLTMDVLDVASRTPDSWGSQGKEASKELAILTKFLHEYLELNGVNVILMSHVIEEKSEGKPTGVYLPFGQGKFLEKGAFYATTNESVTLRIKGGHREVIIRDNDKKARTTCKELPDTMWLHNIVNEAKSKKLKDGEVYFTLQAHIDHLMGKQKDVKKWSL
jgi:hypothetical protein